MSPQAVAQRRRPKVLTPTRGSTPVHPRSRWRRAGGRGAPAGDPAASGMVVRDSSVLRTASGRSWPQARRGCGGRRRHAAKRRHFDLRFLDFPRGQGQPVPPDSRLFNPIIATCPCCRVAARTRNSRADRRPASRVASRGHATRLPAEQLFVYLKNVLVPVPEMFAKFAKFAKFANFKPITRCGRGAIP